MLEAAGEGLAPRFGLFFVALGLPSSLPAPSSGARSPRAGGTWDGRSAPAPRKHPVGVAGLEKKRVRRRKRCTGAFAVGLGFFAEASRA